MKTEKQQSMAAVAFAKKWEGRGYEKGDSQIFWTELLTEVMGWSKVTPSCTPSWPSLSCF
jgi:hypothetical protein